MKKIKFNLKSEEGIHIGVAYNKYEKGNIDSYTIKDDEGNPYIPATSIKGKFRYFLKNYKELNDSELDSLVDEFTNGESQDIERIFFGEHNSEDTTFFNTFKKILFKDALLLEKYKDRDKSSLFEVKAENSITEIKDKLESNPRMIERTIRELEYEFEIFIQGYEEEEEVIIKKIIIKIFDYISDFGYIGGNGTRGYGKVKITALGEDNE